MNRNTALTSTYSNEFDSHGTLTAQSLSKAHRKPLRGVACGVLVAIGIALCIMPNAGGSIPKQYVTYKEYALHSLGYTMSNTNAYLYFMVKRVHGILKHLMDHTMEYLKVEVSGLKIKMVILRYSGVLST